MANPLDGVMVKGKELLTEEQWGIREKDGAIEPGAALLWKAMPGGSFEGTGSEDRVLKYIISSERKDRHRDVVMQDGMDVSEYNGVVLWDHDRGSFMGTPANPPIGKNLGFESMQRAGVKMTAASAQFAGIAQGNPFAETIYKMAKDGFIPNCSVGFSPIEWTFDEVERGYIFKTWALNEWSLTIVGANFDVQQLSLHAKKSGIDLAPLLDHARLLLDLGDLVPVERKSLEATVKALGFGRGISFFDQKPEQIKSMVARKVKGASEPEPEETAMPVTKNDEAKADDMEECAKCDPPGSGKCKSCGGEGKVAKPKSAPAAVTLDADPAKSAFIAEVQKLDDPKLRILLLGKAYGVTAADLGSQVVAAVAEEPAAKELSADLIAEQVAKALAANEDLKSFRSAMTSITGQVCN